jgi:hypothetical protein
MSFTKVLFPRFLQNVAARLKPPPLEIGPGRPFHLIDEDEFVDQEFGYSHG